MPATIFPETWCDPRPRRDAERRVFDALREQLDGFTVFHDCAWVGTRPSGRAPFIQCDFIICHEDVGIIVLEVKGGRRIYSRNGRWYCQPHSGAEFAYGVAPHTQAYEAAFALRTLLKDATGGAFPDFVIAHAVCYPDADIRPTDLDQTIDRAMIIDRLELRDLHTALMHVRDYWRSKRVLKRASRASWLPASAIGTLRQQLARDIDLHALLGTSIAIERATTIRLSEEQATALFVAERTRRLAINGCAGSGKTLLGLLIARRLAAEGKYVLLVCFNRPLCDHLRKVLDYTEIGRGVRTATFHELCGELAPRLKTPFSVDTATADLDAMRQKLAERPRATWTRYDAIIADEGQDFDANWWPVIEGLLIHPERGSLFVFYDDNQRVYRRMPGLPAGIRTLPLTDNFRTTRAIHREIVGFYKGELVPRAMGEPGEAPRFQEYQDSDAESLRLRLSALLDDLRQSNVAPGSIAILTPCAEDATMLRWWEEELGLVHTHEDGCIVWDTVYRFKGLERPIVVLVELDQVAANHQVIEQLLYVAYSRASNRLFVLHSNEVNHETIRRIEGMARPVPASITDKLDRYQLDAVRAELGRVLVWAGAGSGKTRVLTRRIAYLLSHHAIPPEQIMAVTFTNKAAREMKDRLVQLLDAETAAMLTAGTFHAICVRILRAEIPRLPGEQHYGRRANFHIMDKDEARAYLVAAIGPLQLDPMQLKIFISQQKNNGYLPHQCSAETRLDALKIEAYEEYERLLAKNNQVDFDDLLLLTARLLEEHDGVRSRLRRRYRHITVDEFQDTNTTQFRIVELLAQLPEGDHDGPRSLTVVGDAQQAIYSWRQARYTLFTEFAQHFPDVVIHRLQMNYRSTRRIIEVALIVADPQFTGVDRLEMYPDRKDAALEVAALEFEDAEAEAREIARRIRAALDRQVCQPRDIVILLRALKGSTSANETVRQLEIAFQSARIPSVTQGIQSFYRNPIIQSLVIWLRVLYNPDDDAALKAALATKLARNIGQKTIAQLDEIRQQYAKRSLWELLSAQTADVIGQPRWLLNAIATPSIGPGRIDTLKTLAGQIEQLRALRPTRPPFGAFLQGFRAVTQFDTLYRTEENDEEYSALMVILQDVLDAEVSETQDLLCVLDMFALYDHAIDDSEQGKVRIMSIHRSKGLEFPMVFVPAMEEGSLPSERSFDDAEALLEEGRVCYVALTRARDELILSTARRRGAERGPSAHPELQPSRYFRAIQAILEARQALAHMDSGMTVGVPPSYDPYADAECYRARPEALVIDMTHTPLDEATWYRLDRAVCAVPGAYPVQVLSSDADGHLVAHDIGCVCGSERVLSWLREVTGLPVIRF